MDTNLHFARETLYLDFGDASFFSFSVHQRADFEVLVKLVLVFAAFCVPATTARVG